jgi:hypothetical protein
MKIKLTKKLFVLTLAVLMLFPVLVVGCSGEVEQLPGSSTDKLSALLVPDTNLELYIYAKQERSTIVPAEIINMPHDIKVDSLAIWGIPSDEDLVFGAELTFATPEDASEIYSGIVSEKDSWKILKDNKIYVVRGSGIAAESLKSAILNNDFKYYTDANVLEAIAMLPRGGRTKMIALAVAKPSKQVLDFAEGYIGNKYFEQISDILKLLNPDVVIGGIYSPHQINVAKAVDVFQKGVGVSTLDAGILVLIKSTLPGFVVSPVAKNLLVDRGFTEVKFSEFSVYEAVWVAPDNSKISVLARAEGNQIFVAVSGQEDYAQTLITSIYQ